MFYELSVSSCTYLYISFFCYIKHIGVSKDTQYIKICTIFALSSKKSFREFVVYLKKILRVFRLKYIKIRIFKEILIFFLNF